MSPLTRFTCLLATVAMTTAVIKDRRLSCSCFLKDYNYRRLGISCGMEESASQPVVKHVACEKDTAGWVRPGYRYFPGIPALYKLYRTGKLYPQAEEECKRDGGHLAVPVSSQQADAIASLLRDNPAVNLAAVGINDLAVEGSYVTVTGGVPSYLPWAVGNPDNSGVSGPQGEDCIVINKQGLLLDSRCDFIYAFVCQRDLNPAPPEGYSYIPGHGFYKHYTSKATFDAARQRCRQDGGHLAVIDSQEEADELMKFYDINHVDESYVGLNDRDVEGSFVSETGKPAEALNFYNWGPGEPNNSGNNEDCVTLYIGGTLNDITCGRKEAFICELPLPS